MDSAHRRAYEAYAKRDDWYIKTFQLRPVVFFVQVLAAFESLNRYDFAQKFGGLVVEANNQATWLWNISEMARSRQHFVEAVVADAEFLERFEVDFMSAWKNYLEAERRFTEIDLSTADLPALVKGYHDITMAESEVGKIGYVTDCFLSTGDADWLVSEIEQELPTDDQYREQVIAELATPVTSSFVQDEETDLMEISLAPADEIEGLLRKHAADWHWIENSYFESEPIGVEAFAQKVDLMRVDDRIQKKLAEARSAETYKRRRKAELFEQYSFSDRLRRIIDLSERISHITDLRKQGVLRVNGQIWRWLPEVVKRTGHDRELLSWMFPLEAVEVLLEGKVDKLEVRRRDGFGMFYYMGQPLYYSAKDLLEADFMKLQEVETDVQVISGQIAFVGKVTGTARVIKGRDDFARFTKGDILVTNQTTPEFVPLMRQASAVVTDQGGITCHAAIVSRELQIPCIIGTDVATRIIQDGEQILVDAEIGVVSRLN